MPDYIENAREGSGGLPHLILGSIEGADERNPTWITDPGDPPRRLNLVSQFAFQHQYAHVPNLPNLANGFALFFPFRINAGGGDKYICGVPTATGAKSHWFYFDPSASRIPVVGVIEAGGGGGTNRQIAGTTPIVNNVWHAAGLIHTGSLLKIVVNGVVEGSTSCGPAEDPTGRTLHLGWPGTNLSFVTGPDNIDIGDTVCYVSAGVDFTAAELLQLYAWFRLKYPDLPAP